MPDQNVTVGFTPPPPASGTFTVDNHLVTLTEAGKIIFHRKPGNVAWTFVSINGLPPSWNQQVLGNGSLLQVTDILQPAKQSFPYTITVAYNGTQYTSPPAIGSGIANDEAEPPIVKNDGSAAGGAGHA